MSENRDRAMRIEVRNSTKEEAMRMVDEFLTSQNQGRIGFEKEGELLSLWASSDTEPTVP